MTQNFIRSLELRQLRIPFTVAFRHAAAERNETSSLWVEAVSARGHTGHGESCPRMYVTGETLDTAKAFFTRHREELCRQISDLSALQAWMATHENDLDANPAAWCAIELAILDLLARENGQSVEALLSLTPLQGRYRYSAVLGDADPAAFKTSAERYRNHGFTDFKIKLSGDLARDLKKIAVLRLWDDTTIRVRVDANNLWQDADQALSFLHALDYPMFAVEEPIPPNHYSELARIAASLDTKIILDESFLHIRQLDFLHHEPARWLINLRVSKMGGLLRSLRIVTAARAHGIGLVIGAQVGETSLLTRAALCVAHAAGDGVIAQEGAFGTFLLQRDICDPPLMFDTGGILDTADHTLLRAPGLGIAPPTAADFITAID